MKQFLTYKHFAVLILLVTMFIQSFSPVIIISDYYLNVARDAALCVNKAKVELQCKGKCQMTKKLKQEDNREKQDPERRVQTLNDFFISNRPLIALAIPQFKIDKGNYPIMAGKVTIDRPHTIFIPPSA